MRIAPWTALVLPLVISACTAPPAADATVSGTFRVADSALLDVGLPIVGEDLLAQGDLTGVCVLTSSASGRALSVTLDGPSGGTGEAFISQADVVVAAGASTAAVTASLVLRAGDAVTFSSASCPVTYTPSTAAAAAVVAGSGPCTLTSTTAGGLTVSATFNLALQNCDVR
jgi:hypothetical protein